MGESSERKPGKQEPGIKGSVLRGIVEHALEVCQKQNVSAAELERRFGNDGVALLHGTIAPAVWYPISFYGTLRTFLREVEGGGSERYSIEAGAARPLDAAEIARRRNKFKRQLTRVAGIHGALFNFSTMKLAPDPDHSDRVQLEYWDFGAMPRDGRLAVLGFWNELGARWSSSKQDLWQKVDHNDHYA